MNLTKKSHQDKNPCQDIFGNFRSVILSVIQLDKLVYTICLTEPGTIYEWMNQ